MKKFPYILFTSIFFIFILLFPSESIKGAKYGLLLWFNVIIPNLLPFIIISNIIIKLDIIPYFTFFIAPVLQRLFNITTYGTYSVITGFLFGYPMGAKTTSDLKNNGYITRHEAEYLLTFCNNVSPAFIINYIVHETLGSDKLLLPTMIILFLSSVFCAVIFRSGYKKGLGSEPVLINNFPSDKKNLCFSIVDDSIHDAFETITKLGGYLILFGIISNIIILLPLSDLIKPIIIGLSEITCGINYIGSSSYHYNMKYIAIIAVTAFGGLSSIAQTASFLSNANLSLRHYIFSKIINTAISALLTLLYLNLIII